MCKLCNAAAAASAAGVFVFFMNHVDGLKDVCKSSVKIGCGWCRHAEWVELFCFEQMV